MTRSRAQTIRGHTGATVRPRGGGDDRAAPTKGFPRHKPPRRCVRVLLFFHHRSPLGRNWSEPDNGLPKDRLTANPAGYTRHNGAFKEAVAKLCSRENMPDDIIAYGI